MPLGSSEIDARRGPSASEMLMVFPCSKPRSRTICGLPFEFTTALGRV